MLQGDMYILNHQEVNTKYVHNTQFRLYNLWHTVYSDVKLEVLIGVETL